MANQSSTPDSAPPDLLSNGITGSAIAQARLTQAVETVTLNFPTRLRLKAKGIFLREAPAFALRRRRDVMSTITPELDSELDIPPGVDSALKSFYVSKHRFNLIATSAIKRLPEYKGSLFHGAFGHALNQISPHHYRLLYEPP